MGIFNRKDTKAQKNNSVSIGKKGMEAKPAEETPKVESFDISMYELERANWNEFAALLKRNMILPNSYIKTPEDVKVALGPDNRPMVLVTYKSENSSDIREYLLLQDSAFQSVNGVTDDGQNEKLNELWQQFQESIRQQNKAKTAESGRFHKFEAQQMIEKAERMLKYDKMYEMEQEFLQENKGVVFEDFTYISEYAASLSKYIDFVPKWGTVPAFIKYTKSKDGKYTFRHTVIPFSPKTLEFCVTHLSEECKYEMGRYPEKFVDKCERIQNISGYNSENWDYVIAMGKNIVESKFDEVETKIILEEIASENEKY